MTTPEALRLHFATQLYRGASDDDFQRLLQGLEHNLALPCIAEATIFLDGCEPPWQRPHVRFQRLDRRADYADFVGLMATAAQPGERPASQLLFANSDIVFDDSLAAAAQALAEGPPKRTLCLTRREGNGDFPAGIEPLQSQDAWLLPWQVVSPLLLDQLRGIRLGVAGCEHLLAAALLAHGFHLWNPSEDCLAWHTDPNPVGYPPDGERYWGLYVYVPPCKISDIGNKEIGVYFAFSRAPGRYFPISIG